MPDVPSLPNIPDLAEIPQMPCLPSLPSISSVLEMPCLAAANIPELSSVPSLPRDSWLQGPLREPEEVLACRSDPFPGNGSGKLGEPCPGDGPRPGEEGGEGVSFPAFQLQDGARDQRFPQELEFRSCSEIRSAWQALEQGQLARPGFPEPLLILEDSDLGETGGSGKTGAPNAERTASRVRELARLYSERIQQMQRAETRASANAPRRRPRALAQPQLVPCPQPEQIEPGKVQVCGQEERVPHPMEISVLSRPSLLSLHPGPLPAFGHVLVCELAFPLACTQASVRLGPAACLQAAVPLSKLGGSQEDRLPKVPLRPEQDCGGPQTPAATPVPEQRPLSDAEIPATPPWPAREGPPGIQGPTVATCPEQGHTDLQVPAAASLPEHRDRGEAQVPGTALTPLPDRPMDFQASSGPVVSMPEGASDDLALSISPGTHHEGHLDCQSPAHTSFITQPEGCRDCELPAIVYGPLDNPLLGPGSSCDEQISACSPMVGCSFQDTLVSAVSPSSEGAPLDNPLPGSASIPLPQDPPDLLLSTVTSLPSPAGLMDFRVPTPPPLPEERQFPESQDLAADLQSPTELQGPKLAPLLEQGDLATNHGPVATLPQLEHGVSRDTKALVPTPVAPTAVLSRPGNHFLSPVTGSESSDLTPPQSPPLPTRQLLGPNAAALSRYLAASYISQSLARRQGPGGDALPPARGPWSSSAPTSRAPSPPPQPQPPPPPARRLSYATTVSIHVGGGGRLRPSKAQVRLNHPTLLAPTQESVGLRRTHAPPDAPFHT